MFSKILIANRGEIALRVIRACKELDVATVAVHSTADSDAMHVRMADESVCIGPPSGSDSYLNVAAIIAACEITGAEAVHPGYGFLSENASFVQVLEDHGITFIGPSAEHIRMMGDKITAKETMINLGVPCVPGSPGGVPTLEEAHKVSDKMGFPVIVKATAGGGGRGMKLALLDQNQKLRLEMMKYTSKNIYKSLDILKYKYLGMVKGEQFILVKEIALYNVVTKKFLKKHQDQLLQLSCVIKLARPVQKQWPILGILAQELLNFFMKMVNFISLK